MTEAVHTALVTGANRGIGLEVCRQLAQRGLRVILTSRSETEGSTAAAELRDSGLRVRSEQMDVSDESSVRRCASALATAGERVDVVVNNAAVCPPGGALVVGSDSIREAVHTNLLGPFWVSRVFAAGMVRGGYGRIVNVSSGWGTFASGLGGPAAYSVTKAALNALTVSLAADLPPTIKVNAVCPGWVKTRMGGPGATRSVEDGADGIVWLATLPDDGPTAGLFRDRSPVQW